MRALHPNLAARPYRNYGPVWLVVGLLALLTAALLVYNAHTAYRYFATTAETREEITRLENEIAAETNAARLARQQATQFNQAVLTQRSRYVNNQIAERAFSWSELLDDLERVLPADVRLARLSPQATERGWLIQLDCLAKSEKGMIDLLQNMLGSPKFSLPTPRVEAVQPDGSHRFTLSVGYRPSPRGIVE
ncbi:MAG TPA: PilN domain-containing protein [Thermoanaerobaculia bacterium]|nr:PilN domain-containing protein [Thermoanaerobaculia bacterium]